MWWHFNVQKQVWHHLNQNKMKLSLIKQIFNVDKYILAISPSKLIIIGFYEVMKCYSETPPSMFFIICKWWKFNNFSDPLPPNSTVFTLYTVFFFWCLPLANTKYLLINVQVYQVLISLYIIKTCKKQLMVYTLEPPALETKFNLLWLTGYEVYLCWL